MGPGLSLRENRDDTDEERAPVIPRPGVDTRRLFCYFAALNPKGQTFGRSIFCTLAAFSAGRGGWLA